MKVSGYETQNSLKRENIVMIMSFLSHYNLNMSEVCILLKQQSFLVSEVLCYYTMRVPGCNEIQNSLKREGFLVLTSFVFCYNQNVFSFK